jgi:hypothetical protein
VRKKFSDLLPEKGKIFFQIKHEEWDGQFVDVAGEDEFCDKAVIRVVVEECEDKVVFSKGYTLSSSISKPSANEAKELARLFPHSLFQHLKFNYRVSV